MKMNRIRRAAIGLCLAILILSGCGEAARDIPIAETTLPATEFVSADPEGTAESPAEVPTGVPTEPPTEVSTGVPTEPPTEPAPSTFRIHFIDVGQADAALVECDGHYMLIDGGNKADSSRIYAVLKEKDAQKLDLLVATHAHEDHVGGLPGALNYASADTILCPVTEFDSEAFRDFVKYAEKSGGITVPEVGDCYRLGSAAVTILGVNGGESTNDTSIILRIDYGSTSFLFTGDAEREAEQAALASGQSLSATVLKVGHHGADNATTYPFLREIMPEYAVISVGEGNTYGHPTENALSRLRDAGAQVLRTDMHGDIFCFSDGETVEFTLTRMAEGDVYAGPLMTEPSTTPPAETAEPEDTGRDYVANRNSMKFHYPNCSSVGKIKEKNRMDFRGTRQELIDMGYSPCGNCHP